MNPIELSLKLIPLKTEVSFSNYSGPLRKITFVLVDAESQEITLDDSFPGFDEIWKQINGPHVPRAGEFITDLYAKFTS